MERQELLQNDVMISEAFAPWASWVVFFLEPPFFIIFYVRDVRVYTHSIRVIMVYLRTFG